MNGGLERSEYTVLIYSGGKKVDVLRPFDNSEQTGMVPHRILSRYNYRKKALFWTNPKLTPPVIVVECTFL
ncbi:hypothetical protein CLV84_1826 [Neolewinella xylanilytica]|uniref:Uncharacterized protein n=1 Tax=Neolewinella xylanilytica TaxID=1514080 RepID=A0A2S6IBK9_9BACT|nr:hypothetical protein CLV84_1826 [Neolewinella xylanilytica]